MRYRGIPVSWTGSIRVHDMHAYVRKFLFDSAYMLCYTVIVLINELFF